MPEPDEKLESALERTDPLALVRAADGEALGRLKLAEEILELQHERRKRTARFAVAFQTVVGVVAVAGFLVNAYQIYETGRQQQAQERADQARWEKEFQRTKRADKYRAFFDTSALATNADNPSKRLVGYALLREFVRDRDYNDKASLMLEQALFQELRADTAPGLTEEHQAAANAILTALAATEECGDLERMARSIDIEAARVARSGDAREGQEIFALYVRRLLGRAAQVCHGSEEFRWARRPLRDALVRVPALGGLSGRVTTADANRQIAQILAARCSEEQQTAGSSDCEDTIAHYRALCREVAAGPHGAEEAAACALVASAPPANAVPPAASAQTAP